MTSHEVGAKIETAPITNTTPSKQPPSWSAPLAIVVLGALSYSNSFHGPFIFDDMIMITNNSGIRELWPPWHSMFAPLLISRPIIALSLAVNYAISGLDPWSYHAFNLISHILAGLALFGIVRRALLSDPLRERFGSASTPLALAVAIIWLVHPLQTESVTYVIQRCESLMGLFYLVTLYCAIRSFHSPRKALWYSAAIAASAAGMLSKQVMATAPLLVLLYDAMFESGSFKKALQVRRYFYGGLAGTWAVLLGALLASPANSTAGFEVKVISSFDYFISEFGVIVYYLRLVFRPDPLVFDYMWPAAKSIREILPFGIIIGALAAATVWALIRRKPAGFLGAWFFGILSLTSTIMPFADLAFEHRMYLPIAAPIALVVIGGYDLIRRWSSAAPAREPALKWAGAALTLIVIALLAAGTVQRNAEYQSDLVMWAGVVKERPANWRARNNLGKLLARRGLFEDAAEQFTEACKENPYSADAHTNLGSALWLVGNFEESKFHLNEGVRLGPKNAWAHYNLANALSLEGKSDDAADHFRKAIEGDPENAGAYFSLGLVLERQGNFAEGASTFATAVKLEPGSYAALSHLAICLALRDDSNREEAVRLAEKAVAMTREQQPLPLDALAVAIAETGRFQDALLLEQRALEMASAANSKEMAAVIQARLERYRAGAAWRPQAQSAPKPQ